MPPKAPPKKKLTKKELKELEEQRKKEEEEKRKQEEIQREILRKEQEEKQRKEDERLAKLEKQRLQDENVVLEEWRATVKLARETEVAKIQEKEDWEKFRKCDTMPDPYDESQLTTFITQYTEMPKIRTEKQEQLQIDKALEQIQYSETVVSKITELYMRQMAQQNEEDQKRLSDYIKKIRQQSMRRLEEITASMSIFAEEYTESKQKENDESKEQSNNNKGGFKAGGQQNEVYKIFPVASDFRYGVWINPNQKGGGYRHKPIEFADASINIDTGIKCELPSKMMSMALTMRALWTSFDYLSNQEVYTKDIVVGGILSVECLEQLPKKKIGADWQLKPDFEVKEAIKKIYYPSLELQQVNNYQNVSPFRVFYTLPSYLKVYPEDLSKISRMAYYDEFTGQWSSEQIQETKYEADTKQISFQTLRIAPYAYLQDRCTDYPYVSWKLRCVASNRAYLDLEGKRDTFSFEISPGQVMLRKREEKEFAHLVNQRMPAGALLYELQKCGIHLLPSLEDATTAGIVQKDLKCETQAISDVVAAVRSFFIKSSRFSAGLSANKILIRIRENLEYDENFAEDQEKDWKSIQIFPNKVRIIKSRDSAQVCDENFLDETVAHASLFVLLKEHQLTVDPALNRMRETQDILFQDTLSRFLRLTHLLTFTSGVQQK